MEHQKRTLLIVDDESRIRTSLKRLLRNEEYEILLAESGKEGLSILSEHPVGVIISDLMMPEMDGVTFLERAREISENVVEILLTANATLENALEAINRLHLFGYLTKPWPLDHLKSVVRNAFDHYELIVENIRLQKITEKQNRELVEMNENLEELVRQRTLLLEEALQEGITMLATAAEAKDEDTGSHIYRVLNTTLEICKEMGLPEKEASRISQFSIMHDVGKIHVPDSILLKEGAFTEKEMEQMKKHTTAGEKILGCKPFYQVARQIARSHHENWDGSGYPDGLSGEEIPLPARVVAVADVFDALTSKRPYKDAWSVERALEEMKALAGKKFDPRVVDALLRIQSQKGKQGFVKKRTASYAS